MPALLLNAVTSLWTANRLVSTLVANTTVPTVTNATTIVTSTTATLAASVVTAAANATAAAVTTATGTVTGGNGSGGDTDTAVKSHTNTLFRNLTTAGTNAAVQNKRETIIIYPTVSPESVVIPIVSCILGFPLLALLVICCLRRRAKLARERDRRRNFDLQDHAVSLVRFSPIHRLTGRSTRAISLRSDRSLSRGNVSLELDTVLEERSDAEPTQTDIITPDSSTELQHMHHQYHHQHQRQDSVRLHLTDDAITIDS